MISERLVSLADEELLALDLQAEEALHPKDEAPAEEQDIHVAMAKLAPWYQQFTVRGLCCGLLLAVLFMIVSFKLILGPGVIPSLNIAAGLLAFCALRSWNAVAQALGWPAPEFTAQETNVVQTFITACISVAYTSGYGMYLTGMDRQTYENVGGATTPGNRIEDVYEPVPSRVIPYLLVTSVVGVFMLVFLRKLLILDYGLPYPSGTATGLLIASFHTVKGASTAMVQMTLLLKSFIASFTWNMIKWTFSSTSCEFCEELGCGVIPVFGQRAAAWTWNMDGQLQLVGAGMICPPIVNISMLLGAILTWCFLWPYIQSKEGDWYAKDLGDKSFSGLLGYKVFIMVSVFLGDGMYQVIKILSMSIRHAVKQLASYRRLPTHVHVPVADRSTEDGFNDLNDEWQALASSTDEDSLAPLLTSRSIAEGRGRKGGARKRKAHTEEGSKEADAAGHGGWHENAYDKALRTAVFTSENIPGWISIVGYLSFSTAGILVIPHLYPAAKWWMVMLAYLLGPLMSFPNTYGAGLTDWDMSTLYGKLAIFTFAGIAGGANGGVIAGLSICGVLLASTSTASTLMQDFRTGYLVLSAPKAMFVAQIMGALCGVVIAPLTFMMFASSGKVGVPGGPYPVPYADLYRSMAIFGTQGWSVLPKHCGQLMALFFSCAILLNLLRDHLPTKYSGYVPSPTAAAIPFYMGATIAVDMCVGTAILLIWEWFDAANAPLLAPAVASGLIVGDGVWSLPACALQVGGVLPPLCVAGWRQFGRAIVS